MLRLTMKDERSILQGMMNVIRESISETGKKLPDLPSEKKLITEEEDAEKKGKPFPITKNTPQFGDVRTSIEEAIIKTVGEQVVMKDDALLYYSDTNDLIVNGTIPTLNMTFQFRFQDPSGDGIYVWTDALQLSDSNAKTIGKLRNAFLNYKANLVNDADLLDKLNKVVTKEQL